MVSMGFPWFSIRFLYVLLMFPPRAVRFGAPRTSFDDRKLPVAMWREVEPEPEELTEGGDGWGDFDLSDSQVRFFMRCSVF